MQFDLIIIGNELLNGKIQDLNSHFLAQELYKKGHKLRKVQIIGDNQEEFIAALESAMLSSDIILTTGGLGPTKDDLTKSMLSHYFSEEIVYNEQAYEVAFKQYKRGGRSYNKDKIDYHNLPLNFKAIYNPIGYAPAIEISKNGKKVFALPGVPTEFQAILTEEIFSNLPKIQEVSKHVIVKTWKIPEARMFHKMVPDLWPKLERLGEVSSLPHHLGVDIGVKIIADTEVALKEKEDQVLSLINATALKEHIWHIGPESIEEVIVQQAKAKGLTIGFSESCTGGLCASRITDISGSSSVFWGSVVSYANEVKMKSLAVAEQTLKDHGAVSKETAFEMAKGARDHLQVDIAVSTTGIAGPGGATSGKPVGTVGIGVSTQKETKSDIYNFNGNRTSLKQKFSQAALMLLLETIHEY